jgi:serine/threonine protein kinase
VVLLEMLTGRSPFQSETFSDTLAEVLRAPIDWKSLPPGTPPTVRRLLERCLERGPKRRLRDIGEARIALEASANEPVSPATPAPAVVKRSRLPWTIAAAAVLASGSWNAWRVMRPPEPRPLIRMNVEITPDLPVANNASGSFIAISPDGLRLAVALRGADGECPTRP